MIVDDQFHMLRVGLEKSKFPMVVGVVSAQGDDGALYVATGLSVVFAQTGRQTLLLDTAPRRVSDAVTAANGLSPITSVVGVPNLSLVRLASYGNGDSRPDVRHAMDSLARSFAVTVISAPELPSSSLALEASEWAEHLVISIRLGRRSNAADQALKSLLSDREEQIIGVIPTRPNAHLALETRESAAFGRPIAKKPVGAVELFG